MDLINTCILYGDNKTSIIITKHPKSQSRTKHINFQYHYIRKLVVDRELVVKWVYSANMLADGFTKALIIDNFRQNRSLLRLGD